MTDFPSPPSHYHNMWTDARIANRELNIQEFKSRTTSLRSLPQMLPIELTENCNLSCPMCRSAGMFNLARNMSQETRHRPRQPLDE
jgi:hypothetical protein